MAGTNLNSEGMGKFKTNFHMKKQSVNPINSSILYANITEYLKGTSKTRILSHIQKLEPLQLDTI